MERWPWTTQTTTRKVAAEGAPRPADARCVENLYLAPCYVMFVVLYSSLQLEVYSASISMPILVSKKQLAYGIR